MSIPFANNQQKILFNFEEYTIDNIVLCMILYVVMNDIQEKISRLQEKHWTVAALADELGQARVTLDKWKTGERYPANPKAILTMLDQIAKRKRVPKQRRYTNGRKV